MTRTRRRHTFEHEGTTYNLYSPLRPASNPPGHRVRWYAMPGHIPRKSYMRARDIGGWDAECSCGWTSRTGGAIQERVREYVAEHMMDAAAGRLRDRSMFRVHRILRQMGER